MTGPVVEVIEGSFVVEELDILTLQQPVIIEVSGPGVRGERGEVGPAGVTSIPFVFASREPGGHIVVETGVRRYYNPTDRTLAIKQIVTGADVAPGVQAIIYDVLVSGTSIWLDPADRVEVAPGAHRGIQTAFDTDVLGPDDYFTVDVIQIGDTGVEGSGTSLIIGCEG